MFFSCSFVSMKKFIFIKNKSFLIQGLEIGERIQFPVCIIPFPVCITGFGLLSKDGKYFVIEVF